MLGQVSVHHLAGGVVHGGVAAHQRGEGGIVEGLFEIHHPAGHQGLQVRLEMVDLLVQRALRAGGKAQLQAGEGEQQRQQHKGKERTLVISARAKRSGTDFLRLGLNLSDDMRGDSAFNLGASYRVNGINRLGAEWLTRVQIGDQQELYSEFYQPLDVGSRYFVAPYINAQSQNVESILDNDPIAEYRLERYGFGLNLGRQIGNSGEIRVGIGEDGFYVL